MYFKLLLFLFLTSVMAEVVLAQAPPDTTIELPPALIEDERTAATVAPYLRLTVIGPEDLESLPVHDLADALDKRSNAYVQRHGPSGMSTASIRGLGARHTSVYLDGLLLSDPQSNQIDLAVIPVIMLESIEVTHGPGSAAQGAGTLGGAVALNTLRATDEDRVKLELEGGEFGRRRVGVVGASQSGGLSMIVAGEVSRFEGDFPYENPTLIDPTERIRSGADKSSESVYASAGYENGAHKFTASGWFNTVERGLPGPANAPPSEARQWDDHARLWLGSEHRFDGWTATASIVGHQTDLRYLNTANETDDRTETSTADIQGNLSRLFSANVIGTVGLQAVLERTTGVADHRYAGFAEAMVAGDRFTVMPSSRFEVQSTDEGSRSAFIPRFGAMLNLAEEDVVHFKLNIGRAFRWPTFLERYWEPGGNPDLQPESGWSIDGGLAGSTDGEHPITFEVGGFYTRLSDQIVWFPSLVTSGLQIWRPFNVGQVNTFGTEFSMRGSTLISNVAINFGVSATLSRSEDRSNPESPSYGKQLRYTPNLTSNAFLRMRYGTTSFEIGGRHVGQRFITSDEGMALEGYVVFDLQLTQQLALGPTTGILSFQVENLFDADYSVIRFYPMPPRSLALRFGVEV